MTWLARHVKSRRKSLWQPWDHCIGVKHCIHYSGTWGSRVHLFSWLRYRACFSDTPADFLSTPTIKTIYTITSLFLALVLFPQVQKRAQAELDVVVGRDRLPTFNDRPHLPYIEAICKELMRWLMVGPMGTVWISMSPVNRNDGMITFRRSPFINKGWRLWRIFYSERSDSVTVHFAFETSLLTLRSY